MDSKVELDVLQIILPEKHPTLSHLFKEHSDALIWISSVNKSVHNQDESIKELFQLPGFVLLKNA